MRELSGYWTDAAFHGGHSYWAYAFMEDGTGFSEFTNFVLLQYSPIRWRVEGDRLSIFSDTEYELVDPVNNEFASTPYSYAATLPFQIAPRQVRGREMAVLALDLENADAPDFIKTFHPRQFALLDHIQVDAIYHPARPS